MKIPKVEWKMLDNFLTWKDGDYELSINLTTKSWIVMYLGNRLIMNDPIADTLKEAKLLCEINYIKHYVMAGKQLQLL